MKKSFCMAVFVFGDYQKYIPYYIYSVLKSYPQYYVKVFCMDRLSDRTQACLELLRDKVSANFEVKEQYLHNLKLQMRKVGKAQIGKVLKYFIPWRELSEFEYVYIGDVDFLIIKEEPGLLEWHIKHCGQINLPFSNKIRRNSRRLSGLHFIKVDEYYKIMNPSIQYYLDHLNELNRKVALLGSNEKFLYYLMGRKFGFGRIHDYNYRPHHGFHLGMQRGARAGNHQTFKTYIHRGIKNNGLPAYPEFKRQLLQFYNDPVFQEISAINPVKEISKLHQALQYYNLLDPE